MKNFIYINMTTLTLNLSDSITSFLRSLAKQSWKTQREIVEQALRNEKKLLWKKSIISDSENFFSEISNDSKFLKETSDNINMWSNSYLENLNQIDNENK